MTEGWRCGYTFQMSRAEKRVLCVLAGVLCLLLAGVALVRRGVFDRMRGTYLVYFVDAEREGRLVEVQRTGLTAGEIEKKIAVAVENLLSGPTGSDTSIATAIPEDVRLLNCRISDRIVFLDFSGEIEKGGGTQMMRTRLAQIVFTATQFPEVTKVRFMVEGKLISYFSGEGLSEVENPLGKEDFPDFSTGAKR